jgi:hypothetical protein
VAQRFMITPYIAKTRHNQLQSSMCCAIAVVDVLSAHKMATCVHKSIEGGPLRVRSEAATGSPRGAPPT